MLGKLLSSHLAHQVYCDSIRPFVHDVYQDVLGNIIAHKQGVGKKLMLIAHHDVVRLMITYIDNNGFIYFRPSGGIDASILPARKVIIKHGEQSVIGIIGKKPIHLQRDESNNQINFEDVWIDIGVNNKEEALTFVEIGDYAYYSKDTEDMSNGLITSQSLDNYVGVQILIDVAKNMAHDSLPWDVYFVATNFEEIGCRGVVAAANQILPDICFCIDATHATDYPTMNPIKDGEIGLNKGCVLGKGPNVDNELLENLVCIAKTNNIAYQIEPMPYPAMADANLIQIAHTGVRTALISIPCRYMHTPYEIVSKNDMQNATQLITNFLQL